MREKILKMLAELKWGKMTEEDEVRIATTCHNAQRGINTCCSACPACDCHKEIEELATEIISTLIESLPEKMKWEEGEAELHIQIADGYNQYRSEVINLLRGTK